MNNIVYNEDCMVGMARYPDKHFDLAIVDPPYGLPASSTHRRGKLKNRILNAGNIQTWDIAPDAAYFTELFRVSKNQIIWGGNYFALPPTRGFVVWDKKQPWPNMSRCEYAWTSFQTVARMFEYRNMGKKIHPTQKPVKLYAWLLQHYAKQGDKILDTHIGSGSSRIAAHIAGFDFTGFEISSEYFAAQEERFSAFGKQEMLL
jgi:site-specific DNA-methyltransferase (adenine-specific)